MGTPFIGELRLTSFNFPPKGWAFCNGQLLPIAQNQALFSLLGTTYGGDGRVNFALPDLRGRAAMHQGTGSGLSSRTIGERAGVESVTLAANQIPNDTSTAADASTNRAASGTALARGGHYAGSQTHVLGSVGGSQPHPNMPPYAVLSWIIALQGIFPSQN